MYNEYIILKISSVEYFVLSTKVFFTARKLIIEYCVVTICQELLNVIILESYVPKNR